MGDRIYIKRKEYVLAKLARHELGPAGYSVIILDDCDFEDVLAIKLSGINHHLANEIIDATSQSRVIAFDCGLLLFEELQRTFNLHKLTTHAANVLQIIHQSGWSMVDLSWEPPIVVLIQDRDKVELSNYWEFAEDDERGLVLSENQHLAASALL